MTWKSHTNNVRVKLACAFHLFQRLKPMLTRQYLSTVYVSQPHCLRVHAADCRNVYLLQKGRYFHPLDILTIYPPIFVELLVLCRYILYSLTNLKLNFNNCSTKNNHNSYSTRRNGYKNPPYCFPILLFNHLSEDLKSFAYPKFKSKQPKHLVGG